jgi:hypothetical protein
MGLEHMDRWGGRPVPSWYPSRFRHRPAPPVHRRAADPFGAAVRVTAATATTVVFGCLTVAVPCLVFAGVGLWFDDVSTTDAAWLAADCGLAAVVAAVPAVVCHRRLAHRAGCGPIGSWN